MVDRQIFIKCEKDIDSFCFLLLTVEYMRREKRKK